MPAFLSLFFTYIGRKKEKEMKKYYVDVENVGTAWIKIFNEMESDDCMVLYTSKNTVVHYGLFIPILSSGRINRFDIREGWVRGNKDSALDYFLMGELNNDIKRDHMLECIIVSNDKGYDDFINELSSDGYLITRMNVELKKEIPVSEEKKEKTDEEILHYTKLQANIAAMLKGSIRKQQGKKNDYLADYNFSELADAFIKSNGDFNYVLSKIKSKTKSKRFSALIPKEVRNTIKKML